MRTAALTIALVLSGVTATYGQNTQSVINSAGGYFHQDYYHLDWSIGELTLIHTATSNNGGIVLTNGFLQPGTANPNPDRNFSPEEVRITPNPTYNNIEVTLTTRQQGKVLMQVYDTHGRLLLTLNSISNGIGNVQRINLLQYAAGTYFLKISLDPYPGSVHKTGSYKIVKF